MAHRLLCVHPHPDDESISCGGLILRSVAAGHEVHVVTCTGGEEGENQAGIDLAGRPMGEVRRDEMRDAIEALGSPTHHWLGYRDSGMAGEPANSHPDAFAAADLEEAAGRLARIVREVRPHVVVSDDADGTYGHPDHVRAHAVTRRAVALAADAGWEPGTAPPWQVQKRYVHTITRDRVWRIHRGLVDAGMASPFGETTMAGPQDVPFGSPAEQVTTVLDVEDLLAGKQAAMAAHRSQIGPDSFFLNLPTTIGGAVFGVEEFVLVEGEAAPGPGGREDDVFAGVVA